MDLKDIKAIIDLMRKNAIAEFELEKQDFKIKLKRGLAYGVQAEEAPAYAVPIPQPGVNAPASMPPSLQPPASTGELEIKSPMIGTFYRAPSPEAAHYVEIGTEVGPRR